MDETSEGESVASVADRLDYVGFDLLESIGDQPDWILLREGWRGGGDGGDGEEDEEEGEGRRHCCVLSRQSQECVLLGRGAT